MGDILRPCARTSVDLFCTYTSSWWRILNMRNFLTTCSVQTSFRELYGLFCTFTSPWWATYMSRCWPILYTYLILVTYSVHREFLECLSCTHTLPCLTYSPKVSHVHDLVWTLLNFMAYFVYLFLLGEFIFTYFIAKCVCTSCDLFCTHKFSFWPIIYTKNFLMAYSLQLYSLFYIFTSSWWG